MADEQHEVRRVNWQEVFSFPQIFRCFRMAIHPSKLMLAIAAIVLVFVSGWVLDQFWAVGGGYAYPGEIWEYHTKSAQRFEQDKENWQQGRLEAAAQLLAQSQRERANLSSYMANIPSGDLKTKMRDEIQERDFGPDPKSAQSILSDARDNDRSWSALVSDASDVLDDELENIEEVFDKASDKAEEDIAKLDDKEQKEQKTELYERHLAEARRAMSLRRLSFDRDLRRIRGEGIFASFLDWQGDCVNKAIAAVRYRNITGGLAQYRQARDTRGVRPLALGPAQTVQNNPVPPDGQGFLYYVLMAWQGIVWLYAEHWVFAVLLSVVTMAIVALFGGAVNRIAALHFARDERISVAQALRFSCGKFFSFFTSPLIPLGTIVVLGLLLSVGGLLINIPAVGEIIGGLLFALAIIGGLVITFLLVGLLAGAPLMYPTIAVEGSDSFDAISRSFSYVFNRPWRGIFYGLVALVYGVITYLFVRLFAYLALVMTHSFVKLGVIAGAPSVDPQADKLDLLWARPTFNSLFGSFNWAAMSGAQQVGAFLIGVWVFLVAAAVAAYLLTFAASSTTVIYFLLRRKVDATDLDDVYVEEPEELPTPPAGPEEAPEQGEQTGEGEATGGNETSGEGESSEQQGGEGGQSSQSDQQQRGEQGGEETPPQS
ncbi:MAG: hypothetical protein ACLFVW_06150 [Phycisphaerae bacterium]